MTTKDNVLIGIITRRLAESEAARTEALNKLAAAANDIQYFIHERADYTARIARLQTAVEELTEERDAQKRRGDIFQQMSRDTVAMLEAEREQRHDLERIMGQLCDRLEELA